MIGQRHQKKLTFLFLYTRLPDYFLQCIRHLVKNSPPGSRALVVHYELDNDAPYEHDIAGELIELIPKKSFGNSLIEGDKMPDLVYIAGWGDKLYKSIAQSLKKRVPVVMGLDNPWTGNLKQQLAALLSPVLVKRYCTHLWVAGLPQYEFARRLGFAPREIIKGLYCANLFAGNRLNEGTSGRTILYTGRMVNYKRPEWLAKAFTAIIQEKPELAFWNLIMVGEGPMKQDLKKQYEGNGQIRFMGFTQPEKLSQLYQEATAYCLPSHNEDWGVVVHEAAAAGLPLLLSSSCGAASEFLVNGYNGYEFNTKSYDDFKNKLCLLMSSDDKSLHQMGEASKQLSGRITKDNWAGALKSVLIESV